jgi:hypothetical protein
MPAEVKKEAVPPSQLSFHCFCYLLPLAFCFDINFGNFLGTTCGAEIEDRQDSTVLSEFSQDCFY